MSRRLRCAALLGATVALTALPVFPAAAQSPADELVVHVNALRVSEGLAPLQVDQRLVENGKQWASVMASSLTLSHQSAAALQPDWGQRGENVAYATSIERAFAGLVGSPSHRANMVNPAYDSIGIGVAVADNGLMFIAQEFADFPDEPVAPATTSSVPAAAPRTAPLPAVEVAAEIEAEPTTSAPEPETVPAVNAPSAPKAVAAPAALPAPPVSTTATPSSKAPEPAPVVVEAPATTEPIIAERPAKPLSQLAPLAPHRNQALRCENMSEHWWADLPV